MAKEKIVLAYSGGLDTTVIIPWLKENYNDAEVIAVCGNVGQGKETEGLEERALKTGASKLYIEECYANKGPTMKRIKPRAQGRAYRIEKRMSHITVILNER